MPRGSAAASEQHWPILGQATRGAPSLYPLSRRCRAAPPRHRPAPLLPAPSSSSSSSRRSAGGHGAARPAAAAGGSGGGDPRQGEAGWRSGAGRRGQGAGPQLSACPGQRRPLSAARGVRGRRSCSPAPASDRQRRGGSPGRPHRPRRSALSGTPGGPRSRREPSTWRGGSTAVKGREWGGSRPQGGPGTLSCGVGQLQLSWDL